MKRTDPVILGVIIISILLVGGIILASSMVSKQSEIKTYSLNDANRPQAEIGTTSFDVGKMKLKDIFTKEIKITNKGAKPLVLSGFSTSCNCTFVQVELDGQKSPRFSMHSDSIWKGELNPQTEGKIIITYQPSLMPVQGEVQRTAYFKTNDPNIPAVNIDFKATVE